MKTIKSCEFNMGTGCVGIYAPKTAWQKGMADRHPLLCVCSVFIGLVLRDGVQVCFDVSVQNKIGISQRVVVDEIVQL